MITKVKEIIAIVLNISPAAIKDNISPESVAAWDSMKHMDIILALEDEFDITFTDQEIVAMVDLQEIEKVITQK
jgi:acyl carrier protein